MELKIDEEIDDLFDPLTDWEYENLKAIIKKKGIRTTLEVSQDGIIVCGNNRFLIAKELKFPDSKIPYIVVEFKNRQEMIDYAIDDNIKGSGRNINKYQRALVGLKMLPYEQKKAKQRSLAYLKKGKERIKEPIEFPDHQKFGTRGSAKKIVGERVNVSNEYLSRVEKIETSKYTTDEQKQKLKNGDLSINAVFQDIKAQELKSFKRKEQRYYLSREVAHDVLDMKIFNLMATRFASLSALTVKQLENIPSIRIFERDRNMSIISYTDYGKRILLSFACDEIDKEQKIERYKIGDVKWDKFPGEMIKGKFNVLDVLFIFEIFKKMKKRYVEFKIKDKGAFEFISEDFIIDFPFDQDEKKTKKK